MYRPEIAALFFSLLNSLSYDEDASEIITLKCSHIILATILEKITHTEVVEKGVVSIGSVCNYPNNIILNELLIITSSSNSSLAW